MHDRPSRLTNGVDGTVMVLIPAATGWQGRGSSRPPVIGGPDDVLPSSMGRDQTKSIRAGFPCPNGVDRRACSIRWLFFRPLLV